MTQAAFAELGDGFGLAEGAIGMAVSCAVISGEDSRLDDAPYVNQIFLGSTGGPAALPRTVADLHPPGLRRADVPRLAPRSTSRSIRSTSSRSG